jgi:streptogramin lyase
MADSTTVLTSSGLVASGQGALYGFIASGTKPATTANVTFYDNTAGSGTMILKVSVNGSSTPLAVFFPDNLAPRFTTGLYITLDADCLITVWTSSA